MEGTATEREVNRHRKLQSPIRGSGGKESACSAGDLGSIPALGRSPGDGKGYPTQYSGLENSMVCTVHEVTVRHIYTYMYIYVQRHA